MTIRVTEARFVRMLIVCWIDMYSFGHLSGVNFVKEFGLILSSMLCSDSKNEWLVARDYFRAMGSTCVSDYQGLI